MYKIKSIAIFSVATNVYFEYWKEMVISADKHLFNENTKNFHVFTNHSIDSSFEKQLSSQSRIHIHRIPDLQWPLATLNRYKFISEYGPNIDDDVFMHLDADMIVVPNRDHNVYNFLKEKQISLVRHPGYWRVNAPMRSRFYLSFPKFILKDFWAWSKLGGIGAWSTNRESHAYVQRKNRNKYFCGAVWFGEKNEILSFANQLANLTELDLHQDSVPEWNDESYLNLWATKNTFTEIDPSFCYAEVYQNLRYLDPIIIAVDKSKTLDCLNK